jgi:probable phosphoglycerate mutase
MNQRTTKAPRHEGRQIQPATHILLLRHGQTDANASGMLQGHQPTPLNVVGVRQAKLLAERLVGFRPPVDVLISSDLPRALQTAGSIAAACGLGVKTDPAWRERSFGLLEGKPVGEKEMWRAASGELDPPGAEPTTDLHDRIQTALLSLPDQFPKARVIAVVTHGGPIRSILRMLGDSRLRTTRGHPPVPLTTILNCSILHLRIRRYRDGIRWRLQCVNDAAHLQEIAVGHINE